MAPDGAAEDVDVTDRAAGLFPESARKQERPAASGSGVLPSQAIRRLIDDGRIRASEPVTDSQIQPASLDLRLGTRAYRLQASFLPGNATIESKLAHLAMAELDLSKPAVLERGCVYLARLMEELDLRGAALEAKANPKSTTGRLDVFTRLIVDGGSEFERIARGKAYRGPLYAEIMPRTFPVMVRAGLSLSQIRFIRGRAAELTDNGMKTLDENAELLCSDDGNSSKANIRDGVELSVSLRCNGADGIVAYRGRKNTRLVDLGQVAAYDVDQFWDPIRRCPGDRLILDPGDFYILVSRERVRVPPDHAAEMVPFDPSVGEFRIHYAGFFDPGFGYGSGEIRGTRAVLEVRAHEVPFVIEHGQVVGRLIYSRMLEAPDKVYGQAIGSSYQRQELALSKQFRRAAGGEP